MTDYQNSDLSDDMSDVSEEEINGSKTAQNDNLKNKQLEEDSDGFVEVDDEEDEEEDEEEEDDEVEEEGDLEMSKKDFSEASRIFKSLVFPNDIEKRYEYSVTPLAHFPDRLHEYKIDKIRKKKRDQNPSLPNSFKRKQKWYDTRDVSVHDAQMLSEMNDSFFNSLQFSYVTTAESNMFFNQSLKVSNEREFDTAIIESVFSKQRPKDQRKMLDTLNKTGLLDKKSEEQIKQIMEKTQEKRVNSKREDFIFHSEEKNKQESSDEEMEEEEVHEAKKSNGKNKNSKKRTFSETFEFNNLKAVEEDKNRGPIDVEPKRKKHKKQLQKLLDEKKNTKSKYESKEGIGSVLNQQLENTIEKAKGNSVKTVDRLIRKEKKKIKKKEKSKEEWKKRVDDQKAQMKAVTDKKNENRKNKKLRGKKDFIEKQKESTSKGKQSRGNRNNQNETQREGSKKNRAGFEGKRNKAINGFDKIKKKTQKKK